MAHLRAQGDISCISAHQDHSFWISPQPPACPHRDQPGLAVRPTHQPKHGKVLCSRDLAKFYFTVGRRNKALLAQSDISAMAAAAAEFCATNGPFDRR